MLHPDGEPLLAHWQAGLGRAAAFTSNAPGSGAWANQWVDWETASTFWVQLARLISRPAMSQDAELLVSIEDDRLHINYERFQDAESDAGTDSARQSYYKPDGTSAPIRLRQSGPGRYEAGADASLAGNYIVALNPRQGVRQLSPVIGGASRSTGPEFRRYTSNLALLEEVVESTRGRRLDVNDPAAVNLFDRSGMLPSISLLPVWQTILAWALALLLLDVASRRLAWDYNLIRRAVSKALERITPAHVRGGRAADTLATLRRVSDEVDEQRTAASAGLKQFEVTGRVAPPPIHQDVFKPVESRSPSEDLSRVSAALDAFLGRAPAKPSKTEAEPQQEARPDSPTDTTSNLLAAKRRIRQNLGDPEKQDPGDASS